MALHLTPTRRRHRSAGALPDIAAKVSFLGSAGACLGGTAVERIETHFSWVFLTERHVYKLKKPVRADGVDFTTLASRRRNAEAELRLNRRLAPDVYLAIVPLTWQAKRGLAIAGAGEIVDWLVRMRRLPADHMLDERIRRHDLQFGDIQVLADRLARFFATARPVAVPRHLHIGRFRAECRSARRAFHDAGDKRLAHTAGRVARCIEAFVARRQALLVQRLEDGRIVEGHGDLRPEHVCLGSAPRIIDCLEFRPELRFLDPVEELSFLAMECARLGAPAFEPILLRHYRRRTQDAPPGELIAFYKAISALIRARIAILHLQEQPVRDSLKWPARAMKYLTIATRQCRRLGR